MLKMEAFLLLQKVIYYIKNKKRYLPQNQFDYFIFLLNIYMGIYNIFMYDVNIKIFF